jgi:undecaprenyldiphospho-muramoylpentapeptide beta-N-acetylglucosaminyltransferase
MTTGTTPVFAIIAGGGTAGHLLPGLATAEALVARGHARESIRFVGGDRGVERDLVLPAGFALEELPGRGIQRRLTLANLAAAWGLAKGLLRGIRIVGAARPSVVVVLGGYASLACGVGAVVRRVPLVLLEQNARAGAVNRLLRRFAAAAAVSFDGTDLPNATTTGNPLRPEVAAAARRPDRSAARRALGLPEDRSLIAVYSGSLGSRRINEAIRGLVARWADRRDLVVRHVIGRRDHDTFVQSLPELPSNGLQYQVVPYEHRMDLLLQAADVVVARSGGGVAELSALGVPAILVPLPIAPRDHQRANAQALVAAGGAVLVPDDECTAERLAAELQPLLEDPARLASMAAAMRRSGHVDAADRAAALIEEQARG